MAPVPTNPEAQPVPASLLAAAYRQGWLLAGEALRHLNTVGIVPSSAKPLPQPVTLSLEVLMELAALLRLLAWQQGGWDALLPHQLAAAGAALDASEAQLTADPQAFAQQEGLPPLADAVFDIWEQQLAWSGLDELQADVLVDLSQADQETLLHQLADLLWEQRHTGSPLTRS